MKWNDREKGIAYALGCDAVKLRKSSLGKKSLKFHSKLFPVQQFIENPFENKRRYYVIIMLAQYKIAHWSVTVATSS